MLCDPVDLARDEVDGDFFYFFGRNAAIDGAGFYPRAFQDDGPCRDDGITADLCIVHDNGSHADQHFITDGASVDDGIMADRDIVSDNGPGLLIGGMDHHPVLDISFASDPDAVDIATNYGVEPYTAILAYFHVTDYGGIGGDKTIFTKLGE